MNIYVVVDGEHATKVIYQKWIPLVNNRLRKIDYPSQFTQNNYYIFAGQRGMPGFWNMAERAIEDANNISLIDRLVIAIDSENKSYEEMLSEIRKRVETRECRIPIMYIIQHVCLETWLLGNDDLFRIKPQDPELKNYYTRFNIRSGDPEDLPDYSQKLMNRAMFAYSYLRAGIKDKYGNEKHYSKHSAGIAQEVAFFKKVNARYLNRNHIRSFKDFIAAFQE